jgi:hypothetical protein
MTWFGRRGRLARQFVMLALACVSLLGTACSQELIAGFACELRESKGRLFDLVEVRGKKGKNPKIFDRSLGIAGNKKKDEGAFFIRPPIDLYEGFEVSLTMGIPDSKHPTPGENSLSGIEFDSFQEDAGPGKSDQIPICFWGCFFRPINSGLQVFVSSHEGNHGSLFFAGATRLDIHANYTGGLLTFKAREHVESPLRVNAKEFALDGFEDVGSDRIEPRSLPVFPGFGGFGLNRRSLIYADDLWLGSVGARPTRTDPLQRAVDDLVDVIRDGAIAVRSIDACNLDEFEIFLLYVDFALSKLQGVRSALEEFNDQQVEGKKKKKSPAERAIKKIDSAIRKVEAAKSQVEKKGVGGFKKAHKQMKSAGWNVVQAADLILPQNLRDTLPENN